MKNNQVIKLFVLGGLIFMCIIQTIILWLGGTPSQNFFEQNTTKIQGVNPFNIWVVKSSTSTSENVASVAYNLNLSHEHTSKEYEKLVTELRILLGEIQHKSEIKVIDTIDWESLFMTSAISYEYDVPLGLELISGLESQSKFELDPIDTIFVSIPNKLEDGTKISLVSTAYEKIYEVIATEQTEVFKTIHNFFTSEDLSSQIIRYQPSSLSNVSQYIKGNDFMALGSAASPISYKVLEVDYTIDPYEEMIEQLEPLINDFFVNPLLKHIEMSESGEISFTEQSRNVVIYNPAGVLEYIHLAPKKVASQTTALSGYNVAKHFIDENDVVDVSWKEHLYLVDLKVEKDEWTYYFDIGFDGYNVHMDEAVKEQLELLAFLEVTIKDNQVMRVKKAMLELKPHSQSGVTTKGILEGGYVEPINEALEVFIVQGEANRVFDGTKASYVIKSIDQPAHVARGIRIGDKWYYP